MIVHTCFNNTSEHGYSSNILKSGICKYFRRGEKDKFTWSIIEMSIFQDHPKGGGLITNLINRLKILLMEDLSLGEVYIIGEGNRILDEYDKNRDQRHLLLEFCDLVMKGKRNRITSYVNNWYRNKSYDKKDISLDKVLKYKREGDSDELLFLGEDLIQRLESGDESIFLIFNEMMKIRENMGLRYRRREASYLWFEILDDYMWPAELNDVFKFSLQMFMRRGMKERPAFAIWLGLIALKRDNLDYSVKDYQKLDESHFDDYKKNMTKIEIDDYVVNDYHVNKGLFGLGKFAEEGAYVKDEDLSLLGEKGPQYKEYYIEMKHKGDPKSKKDKQKKIPIKDTPKVLEEENLDKISFSEFTDINIIEDGVCGGKVPCISVIYRSKKYILKQMGNSMNYGRDYILVDKCKTYFDLWDTNMKRIVCDKKLVRKDSKIKTFVNNSSFTDGDAIYCMMSYFENIGDLGKNKEYLKDEFVVRECLKIRLFDGLFRSSDNILRNILVNQDGELLSIDEGDLFGKRMNIFNKHEWVSPKNISNEILNEVLDDILSEKDMKIKMITKKMNEYGFSDKINEFKTRFNDYKSIVMSEWLK
tara:strand:- start:3926 stop:5689 length:1764 start_codon:yes stop_codon:yes gene_type:complete